MLDVGVLEPEMVSSECRLERLRLDEDEVVEERTIMIWISSLRELMDVLYVARIVVGRWRDCRCGRPKQVVLDAKPDVHQIVESW